MQLESFKSGTYKQQYKYKSISPTPVNHNWTWESPQINVLLETATRSLSEFNAYSFIVPDVDLFIEMHIAKEANQSSRIEGTSTNINDIMLPKEDVAAEKRDDWQEVHNYINAMNYAINELKTIPLSARLLRNCHRILIDGVRGEFRTPGEFRKSQNWIGGSNITDAVFIPPHESEISELISDLEMFWHNQNIYVPHLIKAAISHYQFETIHPFLDGNGRIGRLLITLYLINYGFISKPTLYLSDFFAKNRDPYYDALSKVRTSNDIIHWVKYFLNAIINSSDAGKTTFQKILSVRNHTEMQVLKLNKRAENGLKLIKYMYKKPIVDYSDVCNLLNITPKTANELLNSMLKIGIINLLSGSKRNKLYSFDNYLSAFL